MPPAVESILSITPDRRWRHGVFKHEPDINGDTTFTLPFIGWAIEVYEKDPDEGIRTRITAVFFDCGHSVASNGPVTTMEIGEMYEGSHLVDLVPMDLPQPNVAA